MSSLWKIFCIGEQGFQYTWSNTAPTECPNNSGHSINPDSIVKIDEEKLQVYLIDTPVSVKSTNLTRIGLFLYQTSLLGKIRRVAVISNNSQSGQTHTIDVYDLTNHTDLLTSSPISTIIPDTVTDCGIISSAPSNDFLLEISCKSSSKTNIVIVNKILIYSE